MYIALAEIHGSSAEKKNILLIDKIKVGQQNLAKKCQINDASAGKGYFLQVLSTGFSRQKERR